jgi:general secretion pathway protein K
MIADPQSRPEKHSVAAAEDGFVLVAVLWILAALAVLASAQTVFISSAALETRVGDRRLRAEAMISAAVEMAALRLASLDAKLRPTSGSFAFRLGRSDAAVSFRSEAARIDLNSARKDLLIGLFQHQGASPDDARYYAERIVAWRRQAGSSGRDAEAELYSDAGLDYAPRHAPFQNVAELRLVWGVPPEVVDSAAPFLTVFNGRADVDVAEADPEVIASLPNKNSRTSGSPLDASPALPGPSRANVVARAGGATRLAVRATLEDGTRVEADIVLAFFDKDTELYRILSWRDDLDGRL